MPYDALGIYSIVKQASMLLLASMKAFRWSNLINFCELVQIIQF